VEEKRDEGCFEKGSDTSSIGNEKKIYSSNNTRN
jgi:hypothetical protein